MVLQERGFAPDDPMADRSFRRRTKEDTPVTAKGIAPPLRTPDGRTQSDLLRAYGFYDQPQGTQAKQEVGAPATGGGGESDQRELMKLFGYQNKDKAPVDRNQVRDDDEVYADATNYHAAQTAGGRIPDQPSTYVPISPQRYAEEAVKRNQANTKYQRMLAEGRGTAEDVVRRMDELSPLSDNSQAPAGGEALPFLNIAEHNAAIEAQKRSPAEDFLQQIEQGALGASLQESLSDAESVQTAQEISEAEAQRRDAAMAEKIAGIVSRAERFAQIREDRAGREEQRQHIDAQVRAAEADVLQRAQQQEQREAASLEEGLARVRRERAERREARLRREAHQKKAEAASLEEGLARVRQERAERREERLRQDAQRKEVQENDLKQHVEADKRRARVRTKRKETKKKTAEKDARNKKLERTMNTMKKGDDPYLPDVVSDVIAQQKEKPLLERSPKELAEFGKNLREKSDEVFTTKMEDEEFRAILRNLRNAGKPKPDNKTSEATPQPDNQSSKQSEEPPQFSAAA